MARQCWWSVIALLALTTCFAISLITIYVRLNDRITSLTSADVAVYNTTIEDGYNGTYEEDGNHTLELLNMTDVRNEILSIRQQLLQQGKDLQDLQKYVTEEMDEAYHILNSTVNKVQEDVNVQVQKVSDNVSNQNSLMAYQFAGTFAILGSLISFWHMMSHIRKLNNFIVQRKIIAILWMIPIYSVSSFLGLVLVDAQEYLALIKDFYEAYCIYTFLSFLISVLGDGDRDKVIGVLAKHAELLKPPIRFCPCGKKPTFISAKHKAEAVLDQCQLFAMQFVFLRPITSVAIVISDIFVRSRWDYHYPQLYIMMIANISIFFAFTGLLRFYHVVANDLNWMHPFSKFLCIKAVVFMTFWQGIVISFIAHAVYRDQTASGDDSSFDETLWSVQAQSFLVCLEMFFFAIAHCFTFPTEEWEPGYKDKEQRRIKARFGDTLALRDFVKDVKLVMRRKKKEDNKEPNPKTEDKKTKNKKRKMRRRRGGLDDLELRSNLVAAEGAGGDYDSDPEIDWGSGWSRIEKYIDIVDSQDNSSNSDHGDDDDDDISFDDADEGLELGDAGKFKIDDDVGYENSKSQRDETHDEREIV